MRRVLIAVAALALIGFVLPAMADEAVKAGTTQWDPGGKHLPENLSDKPFELILVELKGRKAPAK